MSKRSITSTGGNTKPKQQKNWPLGLIETMKDPEYIVKKTEKAIVIKDKYPKAKIHYLVLPHDDISSIFKLNATDLELLEEFEQLYDYFKEKHSDTVLRAGFHAVPSMQRMHMHIISTDMVSPCLKTKVHWNSFTTKFFIPLHGKCFKVCPEYCCLPNPPIYTDLDLLVELKSQLKENNCIKKISDEEHKELMSTPLQCNQCCFIPKTMPQLKLHLPEHVPKQK